MPFIEFKKTYHYWEDDKTYKAGEVIDVDYDHYREFISIGVAVPAALDCERTQAIKYVLKCRIVDILKVLDKHKVTAIKVVGNDAKCLLFLVQTLLSSGEIKPNEILELPEYEGMGSIGWLINEAYNW